MLMVSSEQLLDILGNETRRMILALLAEKPRYTTEIASLLNIGQKAINDHLRIMEEYGVIELYVEKQLRGSPRKYFKVNERFRLEFTLTPGFFKVYILDPDVDMKTLMDHFPEFRELQSRVENIERIRRIEHYRKVCKDLGDELGQLTQAKMYMESLLAKVRWQAMKMIDALDLDPLEKKILFEVVASGGAVSTSEIAGKCKITEEETLRMLKSMEEKGIVRL